MSPVHECGGVAEIERERPSAPDHRSSDDRPVGLILAGGQARRMGGGDKTLQELAGRPLLAWVIDRLAPQCAAIILSANGDPHRFASFGLGVVADHQADREAGPLAGVLAGLDAVADRRPTCRFALTVAGDTPFHPVNLAARLDAARLETAMPIAGARSGARDHPTVALWPIDLRDALRHALRRDHLRSVGDVVTRLGVGWATWPATPFDPFHNINTPDDLAAATRWAGAGGR